MTSRGAGQGPGSEWKNPAQREEPAPTGRASEDSNIWEPTPAHQVVLEPQQLLFHEPEELGQQLMNARVQSGTPAYVLLGPEDGGHAAGKRRPVTWGSRLSPSLSIGRAWAPLWAPEGDIQEAVSTSPG